MSQPTQADIKDQSAVTDPQSVVLTTYPQEITVPITLKIRVNTQEERDSYLVPGTNNVQIGLLVGFADNYLAYSVEELLNINGRPVDEVKRQFQSMQQF